VETSDDPRWIRSREAILTAARALLVRDGPPGVTHRRVAEQAGVGRATVYRHWPQPEQLLLEAMSGVDLPFFRDLVTPVRGWLRRQLRIVADEFAMPEVMAVAAIMLQGPGGDPQMAERREAMIATVTDRLGIALTLAVTEGELENSGDPGDAVALLTGPILYRTSAQSGTVSDNLIEQLIESLGTWRPQPD
jgi:AcrR family transcriptional regulator